MNDDETRSQSGADMSEGTPLGNQDAASARKLDALLAKTMGAFEAVAPLMALADNSVLKAVQAIAPWSSLVDNSVLKAAQSLPEFHKRPSIINTDKLAIIALLRHLENAKDDPQIKQSESILGLVNQISEALGECDFADLTHDMVATTFAQPGRQATNVKNAKKSRLKYKGEAEEHCKKWFADPSRHKNKTAFVRDVLEKEWCKDRSTASKWLAEFIETHNPSAEWRATILKREE